jgi:hypothetical protein
VAVHTNDVVPLLSSSSLFKLCENLTSEDNFNNTFFGKILPHTTAVATEFKAKIILFSETTNINMKNCPLMTQTIPIDTDK